MGIVSRKSSSSKSLSGGLSETIMVCCAPQINAPKLSDSLFNNAPWINNRVSTAPQMKPPAKYAGDAHYLLRTVTLLHDWILPAHHGLAVGGASLFARDTRRTFLVSDYISLARRYASARFQQKATTMSPQEKQQQKKKGAPESAAPAAQRITLDDHDCADM